MGLRIPTEVNMDPISLVWMVMNKQRLDGYKLGCEHGLVQGVVRTDQLLSWKSEHSFPFTVSDDVSQLKQLAFLLYIARLGTKANDVPSRCACKKGCKTKTCACRKANVQCTAKCHASSKCHDWGEHSTLMIDHGSTAALCCAVNVTSLYLSVQQSSHVSIIALQC